MDPIKQSINFFHDDFKTPDIALPGNRLLQVVGVALVIFLLIGAYQYWLMGGLKNKTAEYEAKGQKIAEQYEVLAKDFVDPQKDPNLLNELKRIKADIKQREKLRDFLSKEASKSVFSFANVLYGLSTSTVRNVWLTQISISTKGGSYQLKGVARHAASIPAYIELLKNTDALRGTAFSIFNVEQREGASLLNFTLSSEKSDADNKS